ncbi:CoA-binding protein [Candidatus Woesearchaeota archaeon]|nr:MAG: CoA-binding protein [Candidatus Woesearchaeota archaeon]
MTKKNLDQLFEPKSIAVIGASRKPHSVGHGIVLSLLKGGVFSSHDNVAFKGKLFLVNPNAKSILGYNCYDSVLDIDLDIDLAIICIPARFVVQAMRECAVKKVKNIIIISAGFSEIGGVGVKLQEEVVHIAKNNNMSVVGPNCLGVIRPGVFNASFAPCMPPKGAVAFISQSGALADSIIDWSVDNRYGMSTVISYGNKADMDAHDYMRWLKDDEDTKSIALYLEGLTDGKEFMKVAKEVTKKKPVIVLKGGRTANGQKAISSHTGSLAGSFEVYKTAFDQSGVIVAETVEDLFDLAKVMACQPGAKKNSVAIITNGGGAGVLCSDYCYELGVNLAELKESTLKKLDNTKLMHPAYSRRNPLDIVGDALPSRYAAALDILLGEDYISGVIVMQTLQTMTDPLANAEIIAAAKKKYPDKPIICTYMGGKFTSRGMKYLDEHNIPDYNDPRKAARAMWALIQKGKIVKETLK